MNLSLLAAALFSLAFAGEPSREELKSALQKNPDLVLDVLKSNKKAVFEIVNEAAREEQARRQREQDEQSQREFEEAFKNPKQPEITSKTRVRGNPKAKYTLVEYSDFQCPYCARGYQTVEALRKKYGADLRFVFKNLPLDFHPQAMPAAKYLEAISLQSEEKAWRFHDRLFENQSKLGEEFFKATAQELGVDMKRLEKYLQSPEVAAKIESDMKEAKKFNFEGTPGFLLNGVPVRGAYPVEHFEEIIQKLQSKKS
ncbi:MAG: thioredoxin domain-containing protein [Elusimicrobia bacterium]|nr:thioredoxin domain-containing protein [Elusimicrobiota bacterium]